MMGLMGRRDAEAHIRVLTAFQHRLLNAYDASAELLEPVGRVRTRFRPAAAVYGLRHTGARELVMLVEAPLVGGLLVLEAVAAPGPVPSDLLARALASCEAAWREVGGYLPSVGPA